VIVTILQECGRDWVLRDFYRWLEREDVDYRDEDLLYTWLGQVSEHGAYSGMAGLHKAFLRLTETEDFPMFEEDVN